MFKAPDHSTIGENESFKEGIRQVAEWGEERCVEHWDYRRPFRFECIDCREKLWEEIEKF